MSLWKQISYELELKQRVNRCYAFECAWALHMLHKVQFRTQTMHDNIESITSKSRKIQFSKSFDASFIYLRQLSEIRIEFDRTKFNSTRKSHFGHIEKMVLIVLKFRQMFFFFNLTNLNWAFDLFLFRMKGRSDT